MSKDLLFQDEIRGVVARAYAAIPSGGGKEVINRFYDSDELADLPDAAIVWALGVGNPVRHAELARGEVVLDVGCGAGIDTILAARHVGPSGRVIGLDMLDEMCWRAHAAAHTAGVAGCTEFKRGEMEAIPLRNESVDVVISNGVLNNRVAFGIDDVARYPLFTKDLVALMRELIPRHQHDLVATSVIARARRG